MSQFTSSNVTSNNIPIMQFGELPSQNLMSVSLTECVWEFQNKALWDTLYYAIY